MSRRDRLVTGGLIIAVAVATVASTLIAAGFPVPRWEAIAWPLVTAAWTAAAVSYAQAARHYRNTAEGWQRVADLAAGELERWQASLIERDRTLCFWERITREAGQR